MLAFVGTLAAPVAIYGLAEVGIVGLVSSSMAELETMAAYGLNIGKNALVTSLGQAAMGYTSGSIATLYTSTYVIPNLMNQAYVYTVGNPVMFVALWQAVKASQGNLNGMQNPLTKP